MTTDGARFGEALVLPPGVTWRFGESDEDAVVWASAAHELHVYVDVRTPDTPPGCWHRLWAVTQSWVRAHVAPGSIVPPLLVVDDGPLESLRAQIHEHVCVSASIMAVNGYLLPANYSPPAW